MTMKIEIEIDGKSFEVEPGKMIIEVADAAGIVIPRFCYHKKLSIAANCRMCLVDVEKSRKPLPACATPVTPGMVVRTRSKLALDAQKAVMEFLLINHPLDCPICDQGGQCELQDIALGYGSDNSRYDQGKRSVKDKNLGPLIETEMTRCIHCTRCVRFGREIAGISEMGSIGRGEDTEIGTYVEKSLTSELSANIIDLCPVGALTNKPFRYRARAWELTQHSGVSPHDCVGSNLHIHTRRNAVMRVVPKEHEGINETWISDRDRFSCEGLSSPERVTSPQLKRHGQWETVDWQTALQTVVEALQDVAEHHSADRIGGIISPNATVEELFLFQKLMRGMGCHNIDHRITQTDFHYQQAMPTYPKLPVSIADIEQQELIVVIGGNTQHEQPLIHHRIRKAWDNGAKVIMINPVDFEFNLTPTQTLLVENRRLPEALTGITRCLAESQQDIEIARDLLQSVAVTPAYREVADALLSAKTSLILLGANAQNHPQAGLMHALAERMGQLSGANVGLLTTGANAAGAWLVGAVPHRGPTGLNVSKPALDVQRMWESELPAYVLFNVEPEHDCANSAKALKALNQAALVICLTSYKTAAMEQYADIILPIASFAETPGTFINVEGRWQSFQAAVIPKGEARPGWKVLRVLGNLLSLDGFNYVVNTEVTDELRSLATTNTPEQPAGPWRYPAHLPTVSEGIERFCYWPIYRSDTVVRHSQPLQKTPLSETPAVTMSPQLAQRLGLEAGTEVKVSQGGDAVVLHVCISHRMVGDTVGIAAGFSETAGLAESFGTVKIERI